MAWKAGLCAAAMLLATLGGGRHAGAEEEAAKSPWEFEIAPYMWLPANVVSVNVAGRTVNTTVPIKDLLDLVFGGNALAGAGRASARYDRFSVFVDGFGGYADTGMSETIPTKFCTLSTAVKGELRFAIVDFGVGYRLGQWAMPNRKRPVSLGVYAGMRYVHLGVKVDATLGVVGGVQGGGAVSAARNFADPLIGIEWEVPVLDQVSVDFRGDIGGFGASSDLIWSLTSGVRYWLSWTPWSTQPWLAAGYKIETWDRAPGPTATVELNFQGPVMAFGLVF